MSFTIEQDRAARRAPAGEYKYRIYKDKRLVATYWHDYRGDEHGIEFADGTAEDWPVGQMTDFIEGGSPLPLSLTARAVAYLEGRGL